jgi:hypothetical protein
MVCVLTLSVIDHGLESQYICIMVCVLTLSVIDRGLESQYNGM